MWRDFMDSTPGPEVGCGKVEVTDLEAAGISVIQVDEPAPDCGLKTRGWPEVQESLTNMVIAARKTRTAD